MTQEASLELDLTSCDREPIHAPGHIQPHGVLVVIETHDLTILQVSANAEALLGIAPAALLGAKLDTLIEPDAATQLHNALLTRQMRTNIPLRLSLGGRDFDVHVHRQDGHALLDLEPSEVDSDQTVLDFYRQAKRSIDRLRYAPHLESLCTEAVREIRQLTGYDRVMVYQFHADGHGEVIAEDCRRDLAPYLGLHYPASDIPRQARALYLRNWLRILPDVDYTPVPMLRSPAQADEAPLDMSDSVLRAFSPIHLVYLRNMGVTATMTISLIVDDALWGLIACHHERPKVIPYKNRTACEIVGQVMSLQLTSKETRHHAEERLRTRSALDALAAGLRDETRDALDGLDDLTRFMPALAELVPSEGLAVCVNGGIERRGRTPDTAELHALTEWLVTQMPGEVWSTDALSEAYPPASAYAGDVAGLLAVAVSKPRRRFLLWFRPEVRQTVRWAGDPNKPVEVGPQGSRLTPRGSFAEWTESVQGRSLPWQAVELEVVERVRQALVEEGSRQADRTELLRLQETERVKSTFLSAISHELRTPLNFITGFASVLLDEGAGPVTADQSRYLEKILMGSDQLLSLVDNLLDYTRMEAGHFSLDKQRLDVAQLVDGAVANMRPLLDAKRISLTLDLAPGLTLSADADRLTQVLYNFLSNALKFTPEGGAITIRSCRCGDNARVEVQDNGRGISPSDMPKLFTKFFQASDVATGTGGQTKGTGLGLAIAKSLVEAHGGAIGAVSERGHGSTFYFEIPLAPSA